MEIFRARRGELRNNSNFLENSENNDKIVVTT